MASLKYKGSPRKKPNSELDVIVSSLRKENAYLKKTLVELSRQLSERNKLVEDSNSDEWASANTTIELQNHLSHALEKNKQWLEYDQQREAYVRATLARMLWLEKELNKANPARSQQHNEDHSDVREQISQMQEHYERLLQIAKDELEVLREQLDMAHQNLKITQNWCKERESKVEELKQQLQTENMSIKSAPEDHHRSEDEEQWLTAETEDLQCRLDEEKRRSANLKQQLTFFQKCLGNCHNEDQEKIADMERQIKIYSQDLEDEKQDCLYLKKQMVRVLKKLQKSKDHVTKLSKRDQQDGNSCEAAHTPSLCSRDSLTCSPPKSLLNESFLECPSCRAEFSASQYRELLIHVDVCFD